MYDMSYLKTAEKVTSFNVKATDFSTLKYKKEIQYLFNKYFFPKFNLDSTIKSTNLDKNQLNSLISRLKGMGNDMFMKMHNYNLKGIGPGEVTIFFLMDHAYLGGGSSAGADIVIGNNKYEVKAIKVSSDKKAYNFYTGGTVIVNDIIEDMLKIAKANSKPGNPNAISGLGDLKKLDPANYERIERKYAKRAYDDYFQYHKTIFINNNTGFIESIKLVKESDIEIGEITAGRIKPKVVL